MRVLHLIDSLGQGGAEQSLVATAPDLARLGVELHVAPLKDDPFYLAALEATGAVVHPAPPPGGRRARTAHARALLARTRPALVHTTLYEAHLAGRVAGATARVPVVSSLVSTSYGPDHYADPGVDRRKLRLAQGLDAATARLVRRFHAVSEAVAEAMSARLRVPRARMEVVPRGRDPEVLGRRTPARRAAARAAMSLDGAQPLVLAVGRHEWRKGFDVAVAALGAVVASHPGAVLAVAGREGEQTAALVGDAERQGVGAHLRVLGPRTDVADLLCAADVVVVPSRKEGSPGVVLEAMALEAPLVAADIAPIREVLGDHATEVVVPGEDPGALAARLVEVLAGRHVPPTAGLHRRFLERYTVAAAAEGLVGIYRSVA